MKITAKMLTNESLIGIVDALIKAHRLPDDILLGYYKHGLITQVKAIERSLKRIEEKAKNKKLNRKELTALDRKQYRLAVLGNKKLEILKRLENATDSPAK